MNSFKQALNHFKVHWRDSLLLGLVATAFIVCLRPLPYLSAFAISVFLLLFQFVSERLIEHKNWRDFSSLKNGVASLIIVSVVLFPTNVLVGSALGLLQSPQGFLMTLPVVWGLLILCVYFYLVLSHSLRLRLTENVGIAKAIDIVGAASLKNFQAYFRLSFYLSLMIIVSGLTWGVGFIVTLPLVFFSSHFSYLDLKTAQAFTAK